MISNRSLVALVVCLLAAHSHAFKGFFRKPVSFKKVPVAPVNVAATQLDVEVDMDNVAAEGTMFNSAPFKIINFIMSIPVVHDVMFGVYRKQIVQKAEKMGLEWTEFMDEQVLHIHITSYSTSYSSWWYFPHSFHVYTFNCI